MFSWNKFLFSKIDIVNNTHSERHNVDDSSNDKMLNVANIISALLSRLYSSVRSRAAPLIKKSKHDQAIFCADLS